jgi:heme-degrading monooxygenase HmoA
MTSASSLAKTFSPPYYAVIFTSHRTQGDRGYDQMAERVVALASQMPGFLGVESVRGVDGFGITVSYWESEDAIRQWKAHAEHQIAQRTGKAVWYTDYIDTDYIVRIAKVEREYSRVPEQLWQRSSPAKPTEIPPSTWF